MSAATLVFCAVSGPAVAQWFGPDPWCQPVPVEMWPSCPVTTFAPTHVRTAYLSGAPCNLYIDVTEEFANRFVARQDEQAGPVRDFVLGADVHGEQRTTTKTVLDFRPSRSTARLVLQLDGQVNNRTVGVTPQANVHSVGSHRMQLEKEIEFDGQVIRTRSPAAFITPHHQNVAAQTRAAGVPLIGLLANNIALRAADARRPQAESIAAQRITDRAAPEFNRAIDAELAKLNQLLRETVRPKLSQFHLSPDQQQLSTTDTRLRWAIQLGEEGDVPLVETGAGAPPRGQVGTVCLHESILNTLVDRLPIAGRRIPDTAIDRALSLIAQRRSGPTGPSFGPMADSRLAAIVFDKRDPIRFRFTESTAELVLRIGIEPTMGPEIPTQQLTIPFEIEQAEGHLSFRPGEVQIEPGDPDQIGSPLGEVARQLIGQQIQDRLSERSIPRSFQIPLPDYQQRLSLMIRDVTVRDGWICVAVD